MGSGASSSSDFNLTGRSSSEGKWFKYTDYRTLGASETNSEFKFEGFNDGRVKGA